MCSRNLGCALVALLVPVTLWADARSDYQLHCQGCHLAEAQGLPPQIPPLKDSLGKLVSSPTGRSYLARVPGAATAPIDDVRLTALLNWLLFEYNQESLPPDFVPLSVEEVATARRDVLRDPLTFRQQLE